MARFGSLGERTFSGGKRYILFVCTGNTCRAPMAYGVMKRLLEDAGITDLEVRTAGVMTVPGLMPTQECRHILLKDGIDISNHRSCQLTPEMIKRASLVLGMTSFHVQMALRMSEEARNKTYLLKEYVGSDGTNDQIQDPMGCTLEVYKRVYREIRAACKRLMKTEVVLGPAAHKRAARPEPVAEGTEVRPRKRGRKPKAPPKEETADARESPSRRKLAAAGASPGERREKRKQSAAPTGAPRRRGRPPLSSASSRAPRSAPSRSARKSA